ncbi:MAG: hypothetical protein AB2733_13050 [Candidatus Thiodiazotropha taylori]
MPEQCGIEYKDIVVKELHRVPKEIDASTIQDLYKETNGLIIESIPSGSTRELRYLPTPISKEQRDNFDESIVDLEGARILIGTEILISIHRVYHGAGAVLQAFTVFPRETLEVEITDVTKIATKSEETRTVIDSAEEVDTTAFANEVIKETQATKTDVTTWQAGGGGSMGVISASANLSGSRTIEDTAKKVNKVVQQQSRKASRSRKAEFRIHNEISREEETTWRSKRTLFNPNYDVPIEVIVHESLGHFLHLTQVLSTTLIYQDKAKTYEVKVEVDSREDVKMFSEQVAQDGRSDELLEKLSAALGWRRYINAKERKYYNPITDSTNRRDIYLPSKTIKYHSEILDKSFTVRVKGVVVGINEVQLPSGDVIGAVRTGNGDARGGLSKEIHGQSAGQMEQSTGLATSKAKSIEMIRQKMQESQGEDALKWAELLVEAMGNAHHTNSIDDYYE